MFVLVRMHLLNHVVDTQKWNVSSVTKATRALLYIYDIKFGMLQVRENEISLRKLSRGIAQLRIVEGTLNSGFLSRFLNWFHELRSLEKNFQQSIIQKI